ncbi:hypothetical protein G9X67_34500 [Rhizobium sp. WYCCWR 11152]|uniref:hypothetical protein n=1 Tax=Rhizobium sp. WYCCWR 11152 TaxID=2692316 RepID=UPI0014928B0E|nr:hypothetical protein [Rhizobium sp. WYCCWR 11152]NNU70368.1 hypothetical protein [Rhizobium sp. WYCCWR 11152]
MEYRPLILIPIALALMSAKGCQTIEERASAAATTQGQAQARVPFPDLPDSCTAHVERVIPKVGEKFRWINQRWEVTADNRDRQADNCAKWGADMQSKYGTRP